MKIVSIVLIALAALSACGRPSAPPPAAPVAPAAVAACAAHGAPKSMCFICDASLREKGRLWCGEHGRYEDRCWLCHPELQDASRAYCEKHFLYEDECFLCHPELRPAAAAPSSPAALMCKEHDLREDECGICHPELVSGGGVKVRLPAMESAAEAGIATEPSAAGRMEEGIACLAELTFDQNKLAQITPVAGGIITSIEADLGRRVGKGAVLARLTSSAAAEAQSAYLKALAEEELHEAALARERRLHAEKIVSDTALQQAAAEQKNAAAGVRQARQHLLVLGLSGAQIDAVAREGGTPGDLELRAPFAGEIVDRSAVQGALAEAGRPLFTLADTRWIWAMVSIPESQLGRARVGQTVRITVDSLPGRTFEGRLTWLPAVVDETTRMARGRVEVANLEGALKARMFARALIVTGGADRGVVVPRSALQMVGGTTLVFVRREADLFEARPVTLGAKTLDRVEIRSGLAVDEPVVVAGTFALKSQLLLSRLGAGCVD